MGKKEEVKEVLKELIENLANSSKSLDYYTELIHNIYAKDIEVMERVKEYCETKILKLQKKIEELPGEKYAEYEHENNLQSDLLIYEHTLSILNSNSSGE